MTRVAVLALAAGLIWTATSARAASDTAPDAGPSRTADAGLEPPCTPADRTLPPGFAGFVAASRPLIAGRLASPGGELTVLPDAAAGATATLLPQPEVRFPVPTADPPTAEPFAGVLTLRIVRAGRYRIGLDARAWIDLLRDRHATAPVAHGHGARCSPVRKIVDFDLDATGYELRLSNSPRARVHLMVVSAGPATSG